MYSLKNSLKTFTNAHKVRLTLLSGALLCSSLCMRTCMITSLIVIAAEGSTLFFTSPFPVRELYAAKKSILGCLYIRKDDQIYDVF